MKPKFKKYLYRSVKIAGLAILVFIVLLIAGTLILHLPSVQKSVAEKVLARIEKKVDADIRIKGIAITLPGKITINELYASDNKGDTLIYSDKISVSFTLLKILNSEIHIKNIFIGNTKIRLEKYSTDSSFNFRHYISAFANNKTATNDSESKFSFMIKKLRVKNLDFNFKDETTNNLYDVKLGSFKTKINDPGISDKNIRIREIELSDSEIFVMINSEGSPNGGPPDINISLENHIQIKNTGIKLDVNTSGQLIITDITDLLLETNEIDLPGQIIDLKRIDLTTSQIGIHKFASQEKSKVSGNKKTENEPFPWTIGTEKFIIKSDYFTYDDEDKNYKQKGIDFHHLDIPRFESVFENINISKENIRLIIKQLSMNEKSGFNLQNLTADIHFSDSLTTIKDLFIETPLSSIHHSSEFRYASSKILQEEPKKTEFNIFIDNSKINTNDILFFLPQMEEKMSLFNETSNTIQLAGSFHGYLNKIIIDSIYSAFDSTLILAKGKINQITEPSTAKFEIEIDTLKTTRDNFELLMSDTLLPESIKLPENIRIYGDLRGSMQEFRSFININSSYGQAELEAELLYDSIKNNKRNFNALVKANSFHAGKLFSIDKIGETTFNMNASGNIAKDSFSNPEGNLNMQFDKIDISGYTYNDLILKGNYQNRKLTAQSSIEDENLIYDLSASADMGDEIPRYEILLDLKGAALQELNLVNENFAARSILKLNLSGNHVDNLNGKLFITQTELVKNDKSYILDSVFAEIINKEDNLSLTLNSEPLIFNYSGTTRINDISPLIRETLNHYYQIESENDSASSIADSDFEFDLDIRNTDIISEFLIPEIKSFLPGNIHGSLNGSTKSINIKGNFPHISYNNNVIDSLRFQIKTNQNDSLQYRISHQGLASPPLVVENTIIEGLLRKDSLWVSTRIVNKESDYRYLIKGIISQNDNNKKIQINPDTLILNSRKFSVPVDNYIVIMDNSFEFNNFNIYSGDQQMKATKTDPESEITDRYEITFNNFSISNIIGIAESENELINGILGGNIFLSFENNRFIFDADLVTKEVSLFGNEAFHEISIKADNTEEDRTRISSDFKGRNNNLSLTGDINNAKSNDQLDLDLLIESIQLSDFHPLVTKNIKDLSGKINGEIQISGSSGDPDFNGTLNLSDIALTPVFSNTILKVRNEQIDLKNKSLLFDNFIVHDSRNKEMIIDGDINMNENYPEFNLNVQSDQFKYLGSTANDHDLLYGDLVASLNMNLKGTSMNPEIEMETKIGNETDLHFIVPRLETASIEQEGIVRFVSTRDTIWKKIKDSEKEQANTLYQPNAGTNLNANIEINDGSKYTIVIDALSDERLIVKGNANLSLKMAQGNTDLTGRYEISSGSYTLTLYNLIRKNFTIQEGSSLQWNGDPLGARSNLTAVYQVRTSPLPLIIDETTSPEEISSSGEYQNIPFLVKLNITGELLNPMLDFDLDVPPGSSNAIVETKLSRLNQNESELNKQVFSLLLFNSFVNSSRLSSNNLSSELNTTARNGIGKLLTRKINSFTDRELKNIDVDLAVESYDQSAGKGPNTRTDVSLDVSKQLFDDRLNIRLGGKVNVEDPEKKERYDFNSFAGDVVIEYKIDKDGNYRISGFNKTEYEDVIEGEVNKTGVSFIFQRSFFKIKDLFRTRGKNE